MAMKQFNTPLKDWLTIWIFHEVEAICDEKRLTRNKFQYTGMPLSERKSHNLPTNRDEAIAFIRQHRGTKYD